MNLKQAKELVRGRLSDKRYEHTLNVRKMAVKLAKRYGVDEDKAALAALLHDSAKEISKDEMRAIMRAHPELAEGGEERPTPVWHGICAAILARTEWGVEDEAVLSAIACHTAGKPGMSRLDKIVYLADMTSAERDWPGVNKLRRLELKDLDLAYAPPYSSAKDPVNMAGFMIENIAKGILKQWYLEDTDKLPRDGSVTLLDTRTVEEFTHGHIDGFLNIPVDELRERLDELDKHKPVYVICQSGLRSYIACRILAGNGFDCYNFSGGFRFYDAVFNDRCLIESATACGMDK